jgi:hypothetical protein
VAPLRVGLLGLLAANGCVARETSADTGESSLGPSASSDTTLATSAVEGSTSTSTATGRDDTTSPATPDVAVPIDCAARNESYECAPMDCDAPTNGHECGSLWMDDDGCMRPFCKSNDDCPTETVCFKYGECEPDTIYCWPFAGCWMSDGECHCGAVGGCSEEQTPPEAQMGHCIPPDLRPC